jgi:chromate transporter
VCFALPAALIVLALAVLYVEYGTTPAAEWLLYGIKPVVIAIIAQAIWGLLRTAVKGRLLAIIGAAAFALYLLGVNELLLMFGGGVLFMLVRNAARLRHLRGRTGASAIAALGIPGTLLGPAASAGATFSLGGLFLTFLKIGAVWYGSGYVLLAFLRNDFVERLGWLSTQQLLDAVAVGQITPGPLFTTATFIGYVIGGFPGALVATLGIFVPSLVFVLATNPFIPRLRNSPWLSGLLDGVNVAALGLMAAVTVELGRDALRDGITVALAALAAALLFRYKVSTIWLILGGAVAGLVSSLAR